MNAEEMAKEIDRLALIEDPEQQGYEGAALIVAVSGCTIQHLMADILNYPARTNIDDELRDKGALRWCQDQLGVAGAIGRGRNERLH